MADEASSSGEIPRNLRSHSINCIQHKTEDFETSYDNIDIMQWEDDDVGNDQTNHRYIIIMIILPIILIC